jgi:hypothetical protein
MSIEYTLILLELKKKLTAAEAEKDTLLKGDQNKPDNRNKLKQLDDIIDSLKTQISLLQ